MRRQSFATGGGGPSCRTLLEGGPCLLGQRAPRVEAATSHERQAGDLLENPLHDAGDGSGAEGRADKCRARDAETLHHRGQIARALARRVILDLGCAVRARGTSVRDRDGAKAKVAQLILHDVPGAMRCGESVNENNDSVAGASLVILEANRSGLDERHGEPSG